MAGGGLPPARSLMGSILKRRDYRELLRLSWHPEDAAPPRRPLLHQNEAMSELDAAWSSGRPLRGLLVLPTGAGKTFTAVCWMVRNIVDRHIPVLWLAHRARLLEQACEALRDSTSFLRHRKEDLRVRVISGAPNHGNPTMPGPEDDVLFWGIQSAVRNIDRLQDWRGSTDSVLVVVDEAHHAVAHR